MAKAKRNLNRKWYHDLETSPTQGLFPWHYKPQPVRTGFPQVGELPTKAPPAFSGWPQGMRKVPPNPPLIDDLSVFPGEMNRTGRVNQRLHRLEIGAEMARRGSGASPEDVSYLEKLFDAKLQADQMKSGVAQELHTNVSREFLNDASRGFSYEDMRNFHRDENLPIPVHVRVADHPKTVNDVVRAADGGTAYDTRVAKKGEDLTSLLHRRSVENVKKSHGTIMLVAKNPHTKRFTPGSAKVMTEAAKLDKPLLQIDLSKNPSWPEISTKIENFVRNLSRHGATTQETIVHIGGSRHLLGEKKKFQTVKDLAASMKRQREIAMGVQDAMLQLHYAGYLTEGGVLLGGAEGVDEIVKKAVLAANDTLGAPYDPTTTLGTWFDYKHAPEPPMHQRSVMHYPMQQSIGRGDKVPYMPQPVLEDSGRGAFRDPGRITLGRKPKQGEQLLMPWAEELNPHRNPQVLREANYPVLPRRKWSETIRMGYMYGDKGVLKPSPLVGANPEIKGTLDAVEHGLRTATTRGGSFSDLPEIGDVVYLDHQDLRKPSKVVISDRYPVYQLERKYGVAKAQEIWAEAEGYDLEDTRANWKKFRGKTQLRYRLLTPEETKGLKLFPHGRDEAAVHYPPKSGPVGQYLDKERFKKYEPIRMSMLSNEAPYIDDQGQGVLGNWVARRNTDIPPDLIPEPHELPRYTGGREVQRRHGALAAARHKLQLKARDEALHGGSTDLFMKLNRRATPNEMVLRSAYLRMLQTVEQGERDLMKIHGINIYTKSPDPLGRLLTNPTWGVTGADAVSLGVERGGVFDVESAYKAQRLGGQANLAHDQALMEKLMLEKLERHPRLVTMIQERGGQKFLEASTHLVGVKGSRWEGKGMNSNFITALSNAYHAFLDNPENRFPEPTRLRSIYGSGKLAKAKQHIQAWAMVLRDVQDGSLPMTDLEYMGRVAGRSDVQVYRGVDFGTILHRNLVRNTETPMTHLNQRWLVPWRKSGEITTRQILTSISQGYWPGAVRDANGRWSLPMKPGTDWFLEKPVMVTRKGGAMRLMHTPGITRELVNTERGPSPVNPAWIEKLSHREASKTRLRELFDERKRLTYLANPLRYTGGNPEEWAAARQQLAEVDARIHKGLQYVQSLPQPGETARLSRMIPQDMVGLPSGTGPQGRTTALKKEGYKKVTEQFSTGPVTKDSIPNKSHLPGEFFRAGKPSRVRASVKPPLPVGVAPSSKVLPRMKKARKTLSVTEEVMQVLAKIAKDLH